MARTYKRDRKGRFASLGTVSGVKVHKQNIAPRIMLADHVRTTRRSVMLNPNTSSTVKGQQLRQIRKINRAAKKAHPIISVQRRKR